MMWAKGADPAQQLHDAWMLLTADPQRSIEIARAVRRRALRARNKQLGVRALSFVAMLQKVLGQSDGWRRSLRRLVKEAPGEWSHFAELGIAEEDGGNLRAAAVAYRRALALYRDDNSKIAGNQPSRDLRNVVRRALTDVERHLSRRGARARETAMIGDTKHASGGRRP